MRAISETEDTPVDPAATSGARLRQPFPFERDMVFTGDLAQTEHRVFAQPVERPHEEGQRADEQNHTKIIQANIMPRWTSTDMMPC